MTIGPQQVDAAAATAADFLAGELGALPAFAAVLGTGWEGLIGGCVEKASVDFDEVPGFERARAPGHEGRVSVVETEGGDVLVQSGRLHCYEGYSPLEVSFPIWAYAAGGVKTVLLTAAAGGLNPACSPGDLIIVADHLFLWGDNPLVGVAPAEGRDRFLTAADHYSERLREVIKMSLPAGVPAEEGVYAYNRGPCFESAAEATLLRVAGADAVGMSIPVETVAARYLGMNVAALCCISNVLIPVRTRVVDGGSIQRCVRDTVSLLDGLPGRFAASAHVIL